MRQVRRVAVMLAAWGGASCGEAQPVGGDVERADANVADGNADSGRNDTADARGDSGVGDTVVPPEDTRLEPDASGSGDADVDWGRLQHPAEHRGEVGSTFVVYGRVFEDGVTPGVGAGEGLEAEVGLGRDGQAAEDWQWRAAGYSIDVDDAINDEYAAVLELPEVGTYRFAYRFRKVLASGAGPWLYADLEGSDDGFDVARAGRLEVVAARPEVVDWCRLEGPSPLSAAPGGPAGPVRGRVYEQGLTEGEPSADGGLVAEVGLGEGAVEGWAWRPASFLRREGNDHEFEGMLEAPQSEGERRVAYRFRLAGREAWTYCDLGGSDDGFAVAETGILKIETPSRDTIDYAAFRPAEVTWTSGGTPARVEVVVFERDETVGPGAAPGISVEVGVGAQASGFQWLTATYLRDEDGFGALDNDVYGVVLPPLAVGEFELIARVSVAGGEVTYVDATGTADGYDPAMSGRISVTAASRIAGCQFDAPASAEVAPGVRVGPLALWVDGAAGMEGFNFDAETVEAELGYGIAGTAPEGAMWTYGGAMMADGLVAGRWRFSETLEAPEEEGLWDVVARVRMRDEPGEWRYCDRDGTANGYLSEQAMRLRVEAPRVDYCRIQYPIEPVSVAAGAETPLLFGVVYEPGVTGEGGAGGVVSEVGFGPEGSVPDEGWTWAPGAFNVFADNGFGQRNNDEHRGVMRPMEVGVFAWAWRFSVDGGGHWRVCDESGNDDFDPGAAGTLIVE